MRPRLVGMSLTDPAVLAFPAGVLRHGASMLASRLRRQIEPALLEQRTPLRRGPVRQHADVQPFDLTVEQVVRALWFEVNA